MLQPSSFFGVLFCVSSTAVVACGGSVVFVEDGGDGGSGGSGPTTSSSPTTTKTTTKTTTTTTSSVAPSTTTGMLTPCETFCSVAEGPCFAPGECPQVCADVYVPGCEAQADALILCYAQFLNPECSIGGECAQQERAYYDCSSGPTDCQDFECQSQDTSCDCYGQCFGTNLEQACYATPNQIQCDCFGDFGFIGSCSQPSLSCSLDTGCCKQFFFDG